MPLIFGRASRMPVFASISEYGHARARLHVDITPCWRFQAARVAEWHHTDGSAARRLFRIITLASAIRSPHAMACLRSGLILAACYRAPTRHIRCVPACDMPMWHALTIFRHRLAIFRVCQLGADIAGGHPPSRRQLVIISVSYSWRQVNVAPLPPPTSSTCSAVTPADKTAIARPTWPARFSREPLPLSTVMTLAAGRITARRHLPVMPVGLRRIVRLRRLHGEMKPCRSVSSADSTRRAQNVFDMPGSIIFAAYRLDSARTGGHRASTTRRAAVRSAFHRHRRHRGAEKWYHYRRLSPKYFALSSRYLAWPKLEATPISAIFLSVPF